MEISVAGRYTNEKEALYAEAKHSRYFDDEYFSQIESDTANARSYLYETVAANSMEVPSKFNENDFNILVKGEDKRLYTQHAYDLYDFDNDNDKDMQQVQVDQMLKQARSDYTYKQLNGVEKVVTNTGGIVGNALNAILSIPENLDNLFQITGMWITSLFVPENEKDYLRETLNKDREENNSRYFTGTVQEELNKFNADYTAIDRKFAVKLINDALVTSARMAPMLLVGGVGGQAIYYGAMAGETASQFEQEGHSLNKVMLGTLISTANEIFWEGLSPDMVFGKGVIKLDRFYGNIWSRMAAEFIGEASEEMIQEVTGTLWNKLIMYSDDDDVSPWASVNDVLYAGLLGGIVATVGVATKVLSTTPEKGLSRYQTINYQELLYNHERIKGKSAERQYLHDNNVSNMEELKSKNIKAYNNAIEAQTMLNNIYLENIQRLGVLYELLGDEQMTKSLKLLNSTFTFEENIKKDPLMQGGKTALDILTNVSVKNQMEKQYKGSKIEVLDVLTPDFLQLQKSLSQTYGMDVIVVNATTTDGKPYNIQAVTVSDKIIVINQLALKGMTHKQIATEVICEELIHTLQKTGLKTDIKNIDFINDTVMKKTHGHLPSVQLSKAYNGISKTSRKAEVQAKSLLDPNYKKFIVDQNYINSLWDFNRKGFDKIFNFLRTKLHITKKGTLEFSTLVEIINKYKAAAAKDITSDGDIDFLTSKMGDKNDYFKNYNYRQESYSMIRNTTNRQLNQQRLANNFVWDNSIEDKSKVLKNLDFSKVYDESYYNEEFVKNIKNEYDTDNFLYGLQAKLYTQYGQVLSLPDECFVTPINVMDNLISDIEVQTILRFNQSPMDIKNWIDSDVKIIGDLLDNKKKQMSKESWEQLKNVKITTSTELKKRGESTSSEITLGINKTSTLGNVLDTLQHEIIHIIQNIEGLQIGTSPKYIHETLLSTDVDTILKLAEIIYLPEYVEEIMNNDNGMEHLSTILYQITCGELDARNLKLTGELSQVLSSSRTIGSGIFIKDGRLKGFGKFSFLDVNYLTTSTENIKLTDKTLNKYNKSAMDILSNDSKTEMLASLSDNGIDAILKYFENIHESDLINKGFTEEMAELIADETLTVEILEELIENDKVGNKEITTLIKKVLSQFEKLEQTKKLAPIKKEPNVKKVKKVLNLNNIVDLSSKQKIDTFFKNYSKSDLKDAGMSDTLIDLIHTNKLSRPVLKNMLARGELGTKEVSQFLFDSIHPNSNFENVNDVRLNYIETGIPRLLVLEYKKELDYNKKYTLKELETLVKTSELSTTSSNSRLNAILTEYSDSLYADTKAGVNIVSIILNGNYDYSYKDMKRVQNQLLKGKLRSKESISLDSDVGVISKKTGKDVSNPSMYKIVNAESTTLDTYTSDKIDYSKKTVEDLVKDLKNVKNDVELMSLSSSIEYSKNVIKRHIGETAYTEQILPLLKSRSMTRNLLNRTKNKLAARDIDFEHKDYKSLDNAALIEYNNELTTLLNNNINKKIVKRQVVKEPVVKEEPVVKKEIVKEKPVVKEEIVKEKPVVKEEIVKEKVVKEEVATPTVETKTTNKIKPFKGNTTTTNMLNRLFAYVPDKTAHTNIQWVSTDHKSKTNYLQTTYLDFIETMKSELSLISGESFNEIFNAISNYATLEGSAHAIVKLNLLAFLASDFILNPDSYTEAQKTKFDDYFALVMRSSGQSLSVLGTAMAKARQEADPLTFIMKEMLKKYDVELKFDPELIKEYNKSRKENDWNRALEIEEVILDKIGKALPKGTANWLSPGTFQQKYDRFKKFASRVNGFRYMAMLSKPSTHFKNIVSNYGMKILTKATDYVTSKLQQIFKFEKGQFKYLPDNGDISAEVKNYVDVNFVQNGLLKKLSEEGKYLGNEGDLLRKAENMNAYETRWMNEINNLIFKSLNGADIIALRPMIVQKLEQVLQEAYGKDIANIDDATKALLVNDAVYRAWKVYFRNQNAFSKFWNKYLHSNPLTEIVMGGLVPFAKVSSNIAITIFEHSPLNIAKGLIKQFQRSKMDKNSKGYDNPFAVAEIVDSYSKGAVGTSLMLLGVILAQFKFIGIDEDDPYGGVCLKIGPFKINLSDLAPSISPLLIGVAFADASEKYPSAVSRVLSVINDQTMLGTFEGLFKYNSSLESLVTDPFEMYIKQFVPSIGRGLAQIIDPNVKDTKGKLIKQILAGIPIASYLVPARIDPYTGEPMTRDDIPVIMDIINTLSPLKMHYKSASDVQREMEAQGVGTSGPSGRISFNGDDVKLNSKEYTAFSKQRAKYLNATLTSIFNNKKRARILTDNGFVEKFYSEMNTEERQRVIKTILDNGTELSKINYWMSKKHSYVFTSKESYEKYADHLITSGGSYYKRYKGHKGTKFIP